MSLRERLARDIAELLKPRLIRTIPEGELNAGAQEWEQNGADEVAAVLVDRILYLDQLEQVGRHRVHVNGQHGWSPYKALGERPDSCTCGCVWERVFRMRGEDV